MNETHHNASYPRRWGRAFALGIGLNLAFLTIEIIFGLLANSSALLADAGHNASDVLSLVFAWTAMLAASKKPFGKYTYGFRRTTILASINNAILILVAIGFILWDAIGKIRHPEPVAGMTIVFVAGVGVLINGVTAFLFIKGKKEDLNIKGAFLHMASDAAVSLGVVIAGLIIYFTSAYWVDPVVSFVISAVILYSTWGLLKDSVDLALDAVPKKIDLEAIRNYLEGLPGVEEIHDLHVWGLSTTETALTVHLVGTEEISNYPVLTIRNELRESYDIDHVTIQVERKGEEGCCP